MRPDDGERSEHRDTRLARVLPDHPQDERVNILVVDDRADKLLSLEVALAELNENVVTAKSGKDALRCLLKQDFAVILLDVNMPVMDGFETAAMIRQRPRSETTPIIFVSAINDTENHVTRGYSLGAVDYILAPVVPEILRAKVAVFVELFRKTAQVRRQASEQAKYLQEQAARAQAEAARQRSAFLAEASSVLAGSLVYEETFRNLAHLVVPKLADFCIIDMVEDDGALKQVAVAHREPGKEASLRELSTHYPLSTDAAHGAAKVFRTAEAHMCTEITDAILGDLFPDPQDRELVQNLSPHAYIAIPLQARGRVLGAITLVLTSRERSFASEEFSLAQELANRAALALDNVRLYQAANAARLQAESASQAKDQFLAMLSHELRTPLTPVLNLVSLMEDDETVPPPLRDALRVIRRNVELEARLIDDLLDLTRVSKGKVQLNMEPCDSVALLRSTVEICGSDIADKQLTVEVENCADRRFLHGDPARLQQIFWNLIKNAVKFTAKGGKVMITVSNDQKSNVAIEVTDTGIGIEPSLVPKIFNAFEQVGEGERYGGLGLGLAITKALVQMHGGEIDAQSAGVGNGATFTVKLPTIDTPADGFSTPDAVPEATERLAMRLLLVEDHEDTNRSLSRLLQKRGYEVRSVQSMASALEEAEAYDFDVLISDMGLPDGSGIELMEQLSEGRKIRGIALSGYGMEEDVQRSKSVGFREHLTKPVDITRLDDVIQRVGRQLHHAPV
jgi:signal transduction histidine kinase/DNA-binding response OmpR family regulator